MDITLCSASDQTDEYLDHIMRETARWAVHGRPGQILCYAASLRDALDKASAHAEAGEKIAALTRLPQDNLVILSAQIQRLQQQITVRELVTTE